MGPLLAFCTCLFRTRLLYANLSMHCGFSKGYTVLRATHFQKYRYSPRFSEVTRNDLQRWFAMLKSQYLGGKRLFLLSFQAGLTRWKSQVRVLCRPLPRFAAFRLVVRNPAKAGLFLCAGDGVLADGMAWADFVGRGGYRPNAIQAVAHLPLRQSRWSIRSNSASIFGPS